ncbi:putative J domain-containing protein [Vibrio chagasii]|nr:putative J domain-containing protein [Vibrio chagasii]
MFLICTASCLLVISPILYDLKLHEAVLFNYEQSMIIRGRKLTISDTGRVIAERRLNTYYYRSEYESNAIREAIEFSESSFTTKTEYLRGLLESERRDKDRLISSLIRSESFAEKERADNLKLRKQLDSLKREGCQSTLSLQSIVSDLEFMGFNSPPSKVELTSKYKKLCNVHHPDKGGSNKMMTMLNDSFDRLKMELQ